MKSIRKSLRIRPARCALLALGLAGAIGSSASATPFAGSFSIDGSMTASSSGIDSFSNAAVANQADIENTGLTGIFVGLGGSSVEIFNLTEAVGSPFPATDFLNFPAALAFPDLQIDKIFAGVGGTADCGMAAAGGQTCTPSGTPFNFVNTLVGGGAINSSMSFALSGVTSDGKSTWFGTFTEQFPGSFQSVFAAEASPGTFSDSYSGTITVTPDSIGVPEPLTLSLFGAGLAGLVATRRRKAVRSN